MEEKEYKYLSLRKKAFYEKRPKNYQQLVEEEEFFQKIKQEQEDFMVILLSEEGDKQLPKDKGKAISLSLKKTKKYLSPPKKVYLFLDESLFCFEKDSKIKQVEAYLLAYEKGELTPNKFGFQDVYTQEKNRRLFLLLPFLEKLQNQKELVVGISSHHLICNHCNYCSRMVEELDIALHALSKQSLEERYSYLYDQVCILLDSDFSKYQLCHFENGICLSRKALQEKGKKVPYIYGCCYTTGRVCPYLEKDHCTIACLSCKLFTCAFLKNLGIKYRAKDIFLIAYFFTRRQQSILENNLYIKKEETIRQLLAHKSK